MNLSHAATLAGFRNINQLAVITRDADATARAISDALSPGSFKVATLTSPAVFNGSFRGAPADCSMKVALTWIGDMQIEVIEPLGGPNTYTEYLDRRNGRPGFQHIFLERGDLGYDEAIELFDRNGSPATQHAQINTSVRLGCLTLPPLPESIAPKLATRYCYTSSFDALRIDFELAKFPRGISHRRGLRMTIADEWIPADRGKYYESSPPDGLISDINCAFILCARLEPLVVAYSRFADRRPTIETYRDDVLPGSGRIARIELGRCGVNLVQPKDGTVAEIANKKGEGLEIIRGRSARPDIEAQLESRGWTVEKFRGGLFSTHSAVPFSLIVTE